MYKLRSLITILAAVGALFGFSQEHKQEYPVNFGLTRRQPEATLPVSSAPAQRAERHDKNEVTTRLDNVSEKVWKLADGWEMVESDMVVREGGMIFGFPLKV